MLEYTGVRARAGAPVLAVDAAGKAYNVFKLERLLTAFIAHLPDIESLQNMD